MVFEQVAVVGLPDDEWGEVVVAVVIGACGLVLYAAVSQTKLAPYKRPRHLVIVDDFPRNAMGKVQKAKIPRLCSTLVRERGLLEDICGGFGLSAKTTFASFATEAHLSTIDFFVETIQIIDWRWCKVIMQSTSARRYNGWSVALEANEESIADAYRLSEDYEMRSQNGSLKEILWVCNMDLLIS